MTQADLFSVPAKTVVWDGKKIAIDDAINLVKLQIKLAPSFPKFKLALEYLMGLKHDSARNH